MTEQNTPQTPADPATPATPATPANDASPVARAKAILAEREAARSAAQPPETPVATPVPTPEGGAKPSEGGEPTAADTVLASLLDGKKPEQATTPVDATNPDNAAAIAKFLELDRAQRQRERELDEERRQLEQQRTEADRYFRAHQLAQRGKRLEALKLLDLSYEDLAAEAINGGSPDLSPLQKEIEELRAKLEELPKTYEEKFAEERKQREQVEQQMWETRTAELLKSDADRWGLLTDPRVTLGKRPVDMVYATIEDHYQKTGEVLTEAKAADMLEASLERRVREASVNRAGPSKLDRIAGLTTAPIAPQTSPSNVGNAPPDGPAGAQTTTNGHAAEAPTRQDAQSDEEARARAIETARRLMQK